LYWFNPLVWLAARRLRVERELACDDYVLEVGTRASDYASYLVDIARSVDSASCASPVAVGMACSQLESRVQAILDPAIRHRRLTRRITMLVAVIASGLVLPLASFQPWANAASQQQKNKSDRSSSPLDVPRPGDRRQAPQGAGTPGVEKELRALEEQLATTRAAVAAAEADPDPQPDPDPHARALVAAQAKIATEVRKVETA